MSLFMVPESYDGSIDTMQRLATAADWLETGHFVPEFHESEALSSRIRIAGEIGSWVIPLQSSIPISHGDGEVQDCVDAHVVLPPANGASPKPELEVYWVTDTGTRHSALANFGVAYFEPDVD